MIITLLKLAIGPVGRWVILAALAVAGCAVLYHEIQQSAIEKVTTRATEDANRRLNDALRNGDAVDTSPDKLRQRDPRCRDC